MTRALRGLRLAALLALAVLFLVPFYLLLRNGLATEADITSPGWTFFPRSLHWENIGELSTTRRWACRTRCGTPPGSRC